MGKPQAGPPLGKGRIDSGRLTQDGNRRIPLLEVEERHSEIAKHRQPSWSKALALFEAEACGLELAVLEVLDSLEEQGARLRKLLVGRVCVVRHLVVIQPRKAPGPSGSGLGYHGTRSSTSMGTRDRVMSSRHLSMRVAISS